MEKGKKRIWHTIISTGFVLVVFVFLYKVVSQNWSSLKNYSLQFNWWFLVIAFLFGVFNIMLQTRIWTMIIKKIDEKVELRFVDSFNIFIKAWLGRYIPGKIWLSVGKVYLGARYGVDKKTLSLASFFEQALSMLGHLFVGLVFTLLLFFDQYSLYFFFLIGLIILLGLVILNPRVLTPILNFITAKIKRISFKRQDLLAYPSLVYYVLFYSLQSVIVGFTAVFLYFSLFGFDPVKGFYVLGSFVVANLVAKVSLFAPAGIGVREGVLVALLTILISAPVAILVSISSRLLLILVDIILFLSSLFTKFLSAEQNN